MAQKYGVNPDEVLVRRPLGPSQTLDDMLKGPGSLQGNITQPFKDMMGSRQGVELLRHIVENYDEWSHKGFSFKRVSDNETITQKELRYLLGRALAGTGRGLIDGNAGKEDEAKTGKRNLAELRKGIDNSGKPKNTPAEKRKLYADELGDLADGDIRQKLNGVFDDLTITVALSKGAKGSAARTKGIYDLLNKTNLDAAETRLNTQAKDASAKVKNGHKMLDEAVSMLKEQMEESRKDYSFRRAEVTAKPWWNNPSEAEIVSATKREHDEYKTVMEGYFDARKAQLRANGINATEIRKTVIDEKMNNDVAQKDDEIDSTRKIERSTLGRKIKEGVVDWLLSSRSPKALLYTGAAIFTAGLLTGGVGWVLGAVGLTTASSVAGAMGSLGMWGALIPAGVSAGTGVNQLFQMHERKFGELKEMKQDSVEYRRYETQIRNPRDKAERISAATAVYERFLAQEADAMAKGKPLDKSPDSTYVNLSKLLALYFDREVADGTSESASRTQIRMNP